MSRQEWDLLDDVSNPEPQWHRERPRTIRLGWVTSALVFLLALVTSAGIGFLLTAGAVRDGSTPTPRPLPTTHNVGGVR